MAFGDIIQDTSCGGGHERIIEANMTAGQAFFKGYPVSVVAAGTVTVCADAPASSGFAGFAANGPGDGVAPYGGQAVNWETGVTAVGGFGRDAQKIKIVIPTLTIFFLTQNWSLVGAAYNDTAPAVANIGDLVGLSLIGGIWGIQAAGANLIGIVTDVLDINLKPLRGQGAAGGVVDTTLGANGKPPYWVQFQIPKSQFNL